MTENRKHPLDAAGAAAYMTVCKRFIRRLVRERRVLFHHVGRFVRFDSDDLDAFAEAGRVEVR